MPLSSDSWNAIGLLPGVPPVKTSGVDLRVASSCFTAELLFDPISIKGSLVFVATIG